MEKIKNSFLIASYVLLMTAFFAGGYAFGSHQGVTGGVIETTPVPAEAVSAQTETTQEETEEVTVYTVIMENSDLYLYSVTNGVNTEIARHKLSEVVFPAKDIEMLKNGVTFDNFGDAQELLENFVS